MLRGPMVTACSAVVKGQFQQEFSESYCHSLKPLDLAVSGQEKPNVPQWFARFWVSMAMATPSSSRGKCNWYHLQMVHDWLIQSLTVYIAIPVTWVLKLGFRSLGLLKWIKMHHTRREIHHNTPNWQWTISSWQIGPARFDYQRETCITTCHNLG